MVQQLFADMSLFSSDAKLMIFLQRHAFYREISADLHGSFIGLFHEWE